MKRMYVDTETFSAVDIKTAGTVKYATNCEMILARFKLGDQAFTWEEGEFPVWVTKHIEEGGEVAAHNALFDYLVLLPHLPMRLNKMICTHAKVQAHGLPPSLEKSCTALGAPDDKQKSRKGKALIRLFCTPRVPTKMKLHTRATRETDPKDWELFRDEYLYQDVEALEWLDGQLPDLSPTERGIWEETQVLNMRGIPIDLPMVEKIQDILVHSIDEYSSEFIRATRIFPTQIAKIVEWVNSYGYCIPNLTADTVENLLDRKELHPDVKHALTVRQNISHAAFKKYPAMKAACTGDIVPGCFQYHAAHTGRYGGRLIQPHNFPRGKIDAVEAVKRINEGHHEVDTIKSAVRGMVYHPDGFTIADYNAIEARVLLWLAGEQDGLNVFINGDDPYIWMAQYIFEVAYDEVTKEQRFIGKQAVLGLGYQMGASRFRSQAAGYKVVVDVPTSIKAVMVYRRTHTKVVKLWQQLQTAAVMAVERPGKSIKANKYISFLKPETSIFLYMTLPSGRRIAYPYAAFDDGSVSYMSNSIGQWRRETTYGGKLVENAVQGIARDILAEAMGKMDLDIVMHIHDEIVVVGKHIQEIGKIMEQTPEWAPGLPLIVEAIWAERFKKV